MEDCARVNIRPAALMDEMFEGPTGGVDNVYRHHVSEIGQSEGVLGHRVVSYWVHGDHLMLGGGRMAKSAGNFFRITELEEQGYDPLAFRYLALQAKYRAPLNFSTEGLAGADRALRQLRERVAEWSAGGSPPDSHDDWESRFRAAISNDLDLPAAMALVAGLLRSSLPAPAKASLLKR